MFKIDCPTLILPSLNDKAIPIDHARNAQQKTKKAVLKTYPNK